MNARKPSICGVLSLACAQKGGTGHFRNGFSFSFSDSQLCKQLKVLSYKPVFAPCQSLSGSQLSSCLLQRRGRCSNLLRLNRHFARRAGWEPRGVSPSEMPRWCCLDHRAEKGGSAILGAEFRIGGSNYMLGNYTVAKITACC